MRLGLRVADEHLAYHRPSFLHSTDTIPHRRLPSWTGTSLTIKMLAKPCAYHPWLMSRFPREPQGVGEAFSDLYQVRFLPSQRSASIQDGEYALGPSHPFPSCLTCILLSPMSSCVNAPLNPRPTTPATTSHSSPATTSTLGPNHGAVSAPCGLELQREVPRHHVLQRKENNAHCRTVAQKVRCSLIPVHQLSIKLALTYHKSMHSGCSRTASKATSPSPLMAWSGMHIRSCA